jgi:hypothetical protein
MGDRSVPTTEPLESMQETASPRMQAPPSTFWQRTFAALRHRNYRLWFQGQLVSMVGTWMQVTAQGFLVFQLTHSTAYLLIFRVNIRAKNRIPAPAFAL